MFDSDTILIQLFELKTMFVIVLIYNSLIKL